MGKQVIAIKVEELRLVNIRHRHQPVLCIEKEAAMFGHSYIILLLLWAACSVVQPSPVENQPRNKLEADISFDGNPTTSEEILKVSNQALENDTFPEEDLALPEEVTNQTRSPLENMNLFEGDLDIPQELIEEYYGNVTRAKRAAVRDNNRLWPSGRVYYRYASDVSIADRNVIYSAIRDYETLTCLRFYYRTNQRDYVEFTTIGVGCCSDWIGRKGGKQVITLGPGCVTKGLSLHEIGHAIGFWHEHTRPDRDSFVRINTSNIESGVEYNFEKRTYSEVDSHGYAYDYDSVMHYWRTEFSGNGLPTIEVTNPIAYGISKCGSPYPS